METTAPPQVEKPKRVMSQDQLEKLAHARNLAIAKRREMAAARAVDREALVLEKISAKKARDDARAEKEAERRTATETADASPSVDPPKQELRSVSDRRSPPATTVSKPKKQAVVVETSDSGEEEGFIDNARVFVVRRDRQSQRSPDASVVPAQPTAPATPPDPHAALYQAMFGR